MKNLMINAFGDVVERTDYGNLKPELQKEFELGLDADIWMLPAHNLKLSKLKRESVSSIDVRSKDRK